MPRFSISTSNPPRTRAIDAATHSAALDDFEALYEADTGRALPPGVASVTGKGQTRRYVNPEGFWERDDTAHDYAG